MAHKWWHPKGAFKKKTLEEQREIGKKSKSKAVRKATKAGAVKRGIEAKKTVKTKGGEYEVYAKGALKKAKSRGKIKKTFGEAFKSNCAGKPAGHSFSWTSPTGKKRSYSCAKASSKPAAAKKKVVSKSKKSDKSQKSSKYDKAKARAVKMRKLGLKTPQGL